eukprot:scaffold57146_cov33-Attheya_sp.AAC.1
MLSLGPPGMKFPSGSNSASSRRPHWLNSAGSKVRSLTARMNAGALELPIMARPTMTPSYPTANKRFIWSVDSMPPPAKVIMGPPLPGNMPANRYAWSGW